MDLEGIYMVFIGQLCSDASIGVTVLGAFVDAQTYMNLFNLFKSLGKQWSLPVPNGRVG